MLIQEAFTNWQNEIRPHVVAEYGEDDTPALSESWNNYTDSLCKDGELTGLQYHHCPAHDDEIPEDEDEEREYILKAMGVRLEWREISRRHASTTDWPAGSRHFRVSIVRNSGAFSTEFSQGSGIEGSPTLETVLHCLLMDWASVEDADDNFEEWATSLGYDTDSRKAESIFKACQSLAEKMQSLFGVQELEDLQTLFEDF